MKKITETTFRQVIGVSLLFAVFSLLSPVVIQAQAGRLNQRQIKKQEKQALASTAKEQEQPPATTNAPGAQPNRPRPMQQALQGGNPRLQAIVLDRFLPRLDLSEEQRKQIQIMRLQHVRRMRTLLEMERVHTRAYDEALFDLSLDQREIEKRTAQLAEARADLLNAQARLFLELRRTLTPEQFTRLRQLMEEERALKQNAP
jgi:Spy/CpxP family protein refolding chaperone